MNRGAALIMLLVAIGGASPAGAEEIGVILAGTRMAFWQTMTEGVRLAGKDLGVDVVIRSPVDGAAIDAQPNIQLKMIDYMANRRVAGLVLAPEPVQGTTTPIVLPMPLVLVDRDSTDYVGLSTVATDNFAAGQTAAGTLKNVLGNGAKVALLRLAPNISSTTQRENGFLDAARTIGWDVVIDTYVGFRTRDSIDTTAEALRGYAGAIDAVFAPNETTAFGALRVVAAMLVEDRPKLVAFDWRPEFADALKTGVLHAVIVQDAHRMGYLAVTTLVAGITRQTPPRNVVVDVVTVTRENMNDPSVQAVLSHYN